MGLEPTTFELEVQHANPLRHRGSREKKILKILAIFKFPFSLQPNNNCQPYNKRMKRYMLFFFIYTTIRLKNRKENLAAIEYFLHFPP